jgi:hypothetical protein
MKRMERARGMENGLKKWLAGWLAFTAGQLQ